MRMFVALVPPLDVVEDLDDFLAPRRQGPPRWTRPEHLHVTLAFMAQVADRDLDALIEGVAQAARRHEVGALRLRGGGAFPDPSAARVLWVGVDSADCMGADGVGADGLDDRDGRGHRAGRDDRPGHATRDGEIGSGVGGFGSGGFEAASPAGPPWLGRLAGSVRTAAVRAGVPVQGGDFRPHVTVARLGRAAEATRWLRVLSTYEGPAWTPREVSVIASHLGQGPGGTPRHEVIETLPCGGGRAGA